MKKIISLFKRDYKSTRLVFDEVVPGAEWVIAGEGRATIKYDGTCCMVRDGKLYKRYDRKLSKSAYKRKKREPDFVLEERHFKPAPDGWEAAEPEANKHTGHWPGWVLVGDGPEDKWHREAAYSATNLLGELELNNGTYELVGPKIQSNPYQLKTHHLWRHGTATYRDFSKRYIPDDNLRTFDEIKDWLTHHEVEGIVWHHEDGRMVKIKRRDFGLPWPSKEGVIH